MQASAGRIPAAQGGTLFLDEVGELPLSLQAKLLRFLEHKEVQRLGSSGSDAHRCAGGGGDQRRPGARAWRKTNFAAISITACRPFPLELPPLSGRVSDIAPLAEHFLGRMAALREPRRSRLARRRLRILESQPWEGNVRELQQVMERAYILCDGGNTILPRASLFF